MGISHPSFFSLPFRTSITFSVPPSLAYELETETAALQFSAKVSKDGAAYTKDDQISSVQALGVLCWADLQLYIGMCFSFIVCLCIFICICVYISGIMS